MCIYLLVLQVMRFINNPQTGNVEYDGNHLLPVDQHLNCTCGCSVDPACQPPLHYYDYDACYCRCHNESQALTCPSNKIWDKRTCSCLCRHITHCLDDEMFDFVTCTYVLKIKVKRLKLNKALDEKSSLS